MMVFLDVDMNWAKLLVESKLFTQAYLKARFLAESLRKEKPDEAGDPQEVS